MAELKILRIEVTNVESSTQDKNSLSQDKKKSQILNKQETKKRELRSRGMRQKFLGSGATGMFFGKEVLEELESGISNEQSKDTESPGEAFKQEAKKITKKITGMGGAGIGMASVGYSLYSNYKVSGYQMSGASHAASKQQRKGNVANLSAQLATATLVHPTLLPVTLAYKIYELEQTVRKEIFEIQKSQILAGIEQQNLVRNSIERRF